MKKDFNDFYIVQKNDTIDSIASKYNTNPTSILIKNHMSPKMIKEGTVLFIERDKKN